MGLAVDSLRASGVGNPVPRPQARWLLRKHSSSGQTWPLLPPPTQTPSSGPGGREELGEVSRWREAQPRALQGASGREDLPEAEPGLRAALAATAASALEGP